MNTAVQDQTLRHPSLPPERPRRVGLAVTASLVAALAVGGLSLAALRDDATTLRSEPQGVATTLAPVPTLVPAPTTATPSTVAPQAPATSPATTVAPERLTTESRLRLDGLGPVRIGMSLTEASAAAGVAIRLHPGESGGLDCAYARAEGLDEMAFMVVGGKIVRIDVGILGTDRVRTLSGIGKGSTETEVMKTYSGQIRVEPHHYVEGAHNLVYVPNDAASRPYSMIFEAVDGRVTTFRSGLADEVSWMEGCS
jgi:hypothetical protein